MTQTPSFNLITLHQDSQPRSLDGVDGEMRNERLLDIVLNLQMATTTRGLLDLMLDRLRLHFAIRGLSYFPDHGDPVLSGLIGGDDALNFDLFAHGDHLGRVAIHGMPEGCTRELEAAIQCMIFPLRTMRMLETSRTHAMTDPLTGLGNRRAFEQASWREMARAERDGRVNLMLVWDLDRFKQVNDAFGHSRGDALLRTVARAARSAVRAQDEVFRLGGDEFAAVISLNAGDNCRAVVSRLFEALQSAVDEEVGDRSGISLGACHWQHGWTPDQWFREADKAMYAAKSEGRNGFICR